MHNQPGHQLPPHPPFQPLSCAVLACTASSQPEPSPVLAMSKRNSNAAEIILFLHRLTAVLVEYFKELEEESIRDNFVIIYELLDEMMDFGYPQTTESKILQECVRALYWRRVCVVLIEVANINRGSLGSAEWCAGRKADSGGVGRLGQRDGGMLLRVTCFLQRHCSTPGR